MGLEEEGLGEVASQKCQRWGWQCWGCRGDPGVFCVWAGDGQGGAGSAGGVEETQGSSVFGLVMGREGPGVGGGWTDRGAGRPQGRNLRQRPGGKPSQPPKQGAMGRPKTKSGP